MNKPIQLISALGVGMVFILAPLTAHAENTEQRTAELEKQVEELQEQAEELRKQVAELQKRVATLEPIPKQNQESSERSKPEATGKWTIRTNWLSLESGMTKKKVVELLGEPETVRVMPYGHNWFYQSGYTMFDHMGRLKRWSKPL
jgi:TolA-binding protein